MRYDLAAAKDWARAHLRDYFVTTTMPFRADLSIDEAGMRTNVEHILSLASTGGLYVGSIYQEFMALTLDERKRVAEIALDTVAGRVPVMVGISGNCVADVVDLAHHAREHGADLVMLWPPMFGLRTPDGVLDFYRRVAQEAGIGICVYASSFGELGFRLTPDMLVELAKVDAVCAVKEASMSIAIYYETLAKVGDKLVVSMPAEEYWLSGRLVMGAARASEVFLGTSRPLYCETLARPLTSSFLAAARGDDVQQARALMLEIRGVADAIFARHHARGAHEVALTKAITGLYGMATGPVRPPLGYPAPDVVDEAQDILVRSGLLQRHTARAQG